MMHNTNEAQRLMIEGISNVRMISGNALVTAVYQGPEKTDESPDDDTYLIDVNELFPGQVQISLSDSSGSKYHAWVVVPYGHHLITTGEGKTPKPEPFSLNQSFGFFAMPRVGDKVFVIGTTSGTDPSASQVYVFGSVFAIGPHRPALTDSDDLQTLHRSGASIRFNDTYAGGGFIDAEGNETSGTSKYMDGLTGNVTITGNRTMILSGSKYLPHGLLAKYGDPRDIFKISKIDTFNDRVDTYENLFTNEEEPDKYYDPFTDELIDSSSFFLSPPSTDDSVIPLTDNTMLMLQHGGGVMRIDDHDTEPGYSRMTMSAASVTTLVGKDYQGVGLAGDSTSPNGHDDASGIDEVADEFAIYHIQGARFKVYAAGDVDVWAAPGKNITIKSMDGEGKVLLGEGTKAVFRDGDETTTDKASGMHICKVMKEPVTHTHHGHSHKGKEHQDETFA